MAAGNQQRHKRELRRILFQHRCQKMPFHMVNRMPASHAKASERPTVAPTSSAPTRPGPRYRPRHQYQLNLTRPLSAPPESGEPFARGHERPVQARRRRSQRAISPDYTVGWPEALFVVVNGDAGFIAGCFNTVHA
jgi:hypothetical protein